MTEPETEPEANLIRRSTEATITKPENEEILEVQKMLSVITPRKQSKRIVKPSVKIVEVYTQRMRKITRNLSKKKNHQRRQSADNGNQSYDMIEE